MKERYVHIDVLFGQVQPEQVLARLFWRLEHSFTQELQQVKECYGKDLDYMVDSSFISENCYLHAVRSLPQNARRTEDELMQRYRELNCFFLEKRPTGGLFVLLDEYARDVLCYRNSEPLCRQEHILDWRERSLSIGQDIFICAGLAAQDVRSKCISNYFSWPAAIRTDNIDLRRMLKQGISENHFHLNGSTRIFSLSWSYLMNHPTKTLAYFRSKDFREALYPTSNYGGIDNKLSYQQCIYDAAWIREKLYRTICFGKESSLIQKFREFHYKPDAVKDLNESIQSLFLNSTSICSETNDPARQLDYAMNGNLLQSNSGAVRLLAAERGFLYRCFLLFFSDANGNWKEEQDLFYLYLLLQIRFRRELIQSNSQSGFRNFARYEQRKGNVWSDDAQYWEESYRLSAGSVLTEQEEGTSVVQSLELRITPKPTPQKLYQSIYAIDRAIQEILQEESGERHLTRNELKEQMQENSRFFYVIHFVKMPMESVEQVKKRKSEICSPRNQETRQYAEKYAKSTAQALRSSNYLCSRIRGIDGCNHEIRCRPETFATSFRFLRSLSSVSSIQNIKMQRYWPLLGITYHVGEDFLELTDGLRAIDEAICFLDMERGDRLGHALALGTEPEQYYRIKGKSVYLSAQDLLDNLVWVLSRSLEWNIQISSNLRASMERRAEQLLRQIYGNIAGIQKISLQEYYFSWLLRGDDPTIYEDICYSSVGLKKRLEKSSCDSSSLSELYEYAKLDKKIWKYDAQMQRRPDSEIFDALEDQMRLNDDVQKLLYYYHFGTRERIEGEKPERFEVTPEYIRMIRELQNKMMQNIMSKGISIECNPSSNKLIGTFDRYEKHPIFRFNHIGLPRDEYPDENAELQVSINTDDQGVFDTSLENEYALLYGCLQMRKDQKGDSVMDLSTIREYLDQVRKMGNNCIFPKASCCTPRQAFDPQKGTFL